MIPLTQTLPQDQYRFIALDVETSCGDSASICQIGLACVTAQNQIETYATSVDPQMPFAAFNVQLHGIDRATVAGAPTFPEIWSVMAPLLTRHPLVQHSRFDERAIDAACERHNLRRPGLSWYNSVTLARTAWPELKGNGGHGLGNLKKVLNLEFKHHDAGEDARAAAQVKLQAETTLKKTFEQMTRRTSNLQMSFPF